jgi:putative glycerol-1-phosphate prenyltransferase
VEAAPILQKTKLEVIPTAYMLVDSGKPTTAHYMSNTQPIPHDKPDIAAATALAGEMLGLRLAYLDGGSGAQIPVAAEMVRRVSEMLHIPLMIGGGIRTAHAALTAWRAGADMLVIGTALEQDPDCRILHDIAEARASYLQQHPVLP